MDATGLPFSVSLTNTLGVTPPAPVLIGSGVSSNALMTGATTVTVMMAVSQLVAFNLSQI